MKLYKTKKIATKVTVKIALGLLVVFVALMLIIENSIKIDLIRREQDKLTLLATESASVAREFMESMYDKQSVLINTIANLNGIEDEEKINLLSRIISTTKEEESNALSLFFVAEPNEFFQNSSKGYTIFATDTDTKAEADMYKYVSKEPYEKVKREKTMTIVDPFLKTIDGKEYMVITVVLPILDSHGKFIGAVGSNIDTELLNNAEYNNGGFNTFATQIICGHSTVVTNSKNPEQVGKPYLSVSNSTNAQKIVDSANNKEAFTFVDTSTDGTKYYTSYVPFYLKGSSVVWLSGTNITKAEFDSHMIKEITFIALWLLGALIVLTLLSYFIIKKSLHPIGSLNEAVKALSEGNLQYQLKVESDDEFGSLAQNFQTSTQILYSYVRDIDRAMSEMAKGNFNLNSTQPFIGDFKNIEASIDKFASTMSSTLSRLRVAADQVSIGSDQVSDGAQGLAQSATEQASAVDLLSTSISEISMQIKNTANNATGANRLADNVGAKINTSNEQMIAMESAMAEINSSSEAIGKIIKTIEDIAFQTNILALNAAVEAARAGSAGKGFAVVADEVRNLATKSSVAAKQTSLLIEGSVATVKNGVKIASETAESLQEVVIGANEIIQLISGISDASIAQSGSISQITHGIDQISDAIQMNSATSEESAASSEELSGQAEMMKALVSQFTLKPNDR